MQLIFRNPQFRMLWISYSLSDVGMISFVMIHGWLALTITNSPFWVGATVGVNGIGLCISSMFSGVLVDRLDRRKLVIASLIIQALTAFILAVFIFSDIEDEYSPIFFQLVIYFINIIFLVDEKII